MSDSVCFSAQVARVQTLVDGGLRVTLDLPEDSVVAVAQLMEFKRLRIYLQVECKPDASESGQAM